MMYKNLSRLVLAAALTTTGALYAQSSTQGAIDGTVFDATNALVGKATVTITNNATAATTTIMSDESGFFKAPLLEPGVYTVTVTAAGFETFKSANVTVTLGQATEVMPHLVVGAGGTVVEVTSEAPVLNFDSPDFSANLNTRALENVPVNNLRWSSLALTTPGVVSDSNGFGLVSVRGISPLLNNVLIDGADDNQAYYAEERGRTREAYSTPPEAVAEFNVNTGVYPAQYGRAAGGVINSVTKSGGNVGGRIPLHGQIYFFDRESSWGAFNPYTTNTTCATCTATPPVYNFVTTPYKPSDSRKIGGFNAGGAIIKDKLFWDYTFDEHRRLFPGTAKANNPATFFAQPDAAISGLANQVTSPAGNTYTCNLSTGYLAPNSGAVVAPALDGQVCTLAARLGLASYGAGITQYAGGLVALLSDLGNVPRFGDQGVNMAKLDYQLNGRNHVSLLYNRLRWDSPGGVQTQATNNYAIDTFGTDFVKLDYTVAKLTTQVTSRISNEVLYQYGRELNDEGQQPFSAFTKQYLQNGTPGNTPEVALATSTGFYLGSPYYSYRKALPDERKWQVGDTLYMDRGNHSFSFGLDAVHNYDLLNNTYESNGVITYGYTSNFLADLASEGKATDTCNSSALPTGTATASAVGLYPCYSSIAQGFGNPQFGISTFDYGVFAQDHWKLSPRLTLELGLRYDYEKLPGNSANANLTVAATGYVPFAGVTNAPSDKNNIGPRVGFALDMFGTGKTVLRGGYGMYYGRITNGVLLNVLLNTGSPNGQFLSTLNNSTFCNNTTVLCASGTTPTTVAPVFPNVIGGGSLPVAGAYFLAPNLQNPMVHEFDLIVQQQIGRGTVVSASYLGGLGRNLTNYVNTNLSPTTVATTITVADPSGKGPLAAGTQFVVPQYTAYINKSFTNLSEVISNINSSYNGAAIEVQNKSLKTIQFDVNYVWSHALDFNQAANTTTAVNGQYDPYGGQTHDYGNSNYNVPSRLAGYVLYNFPNTHNGATWAKYLINDWSFNTGFQAQSGLPFSASLSGKAAGALLSSSWNGAAGGSFVVPIGRNTYKDPRDLVEDVRLQKAFSFTERYKGEARVDLFNVYNHQNVTGVNTTAYALTASSATAGSASTATYQSGLAGSNTSAFGAPSNSNSSGFLYTPRQVQISFKFLF